MFNLSSFENSDYFALLLVISFSFSITLLLLTSETSSAFYAFTPRPALRAEQGEPLYNNII